MPRPQIHDPSTYLVGAVLTLLFIAYMAISGCSQGPREGDIYENLLTGQRVEIEGVGQCGAMYRAASSLLDRMVNRIDSTDYDQRRAMANLMGLPIFSGTDSTAQCVEYKNSVRLPEMGRVPVREFVPVAEIVEPKWRRINE